MKVLLPDRVEIWRQYWLLGVVIEQIRSKVGKGTEQGEVYSWPTVKKVALAFLELGEPEVRALEDPLLLAKWRELKGKQNDVGMTKQQIEELLASAYWTGPLKPDGVEDMSLLPLLPPGSAPEESRSPEEREARLLPPNTRALSGSRGDEARTRERSRELRRRAFGI